MKKRDIIKELQVDPRIYATCPATGASFPLRKALMFYVDEPIPDKVKQYLAERQKDIKNRRRKLVENRQKTRERVGKATTSVNIGKMLEKVAPAIRGFKFDPRDCRSLFEPIDYIIFDKLTRRNGLVDAIYFIDIKTGGASLSRHQRQIRDAVQAGKIVFDKYQGWL